MNIVYVSCLCSSSVFTSLFPDANKMPGQQVQKYHRLLATGLASCADVVVNTISNYPINRSNCDFNFIHSTTDYEGSVKYRYLSACNIPIVRNIWNLVQSFANVWKISTLNKESVILCDILNVSVSIGTLIAARFLGIPTVGIVTDIPKFLSNNPNGFGTRLNTTLLNTFDSYVFLTEAMTGVVNCKNKPYTVIEGQVDISMIDMPNLLTNKYEKKVCLYAGGLQRIYGIPYLVQAFLEADVPDAELHIYGSGDYQEELIELCQQHTSIRYFGVKPNSDVVQAEIRATLLINPRPTTEEYTNYSFPSKNMEYMVSGTPVLTTKLPGMPAEYDDYVYLIEQETVDGLAQTLTAVLSKSPEELHEFGAKAKEFVLREKNNVVQAEKIIKMFEGDKVDK